MIRVISGGFVKFKLQVLFVQSPRRCYSTGPHKDHDCLTGNQSKMTEKYIANRRIPHMRTIWLGYETFSTHKYMGNNLQMNVYNKSKCQEGDPCSSYIKLTKSQYYCYRIHGYFCPVFILFSPFHTGKMFRSIFFKFHVHV